MPKKALPCYSLCLLLCFTLLPSAEAELPKVVLETMSQAAEDLKANRPSTLSDAQKSLLVWYNDDINRAEMSGWFEGNPDLYQASQQVHAEVSSTVAGNVANDVNAGFDVQTRLQPDFMPGTDSDYIFELDPNSADPVDDVRKLQRGYNDNLNDFMRRSIDNDPKVRAALEAEGVHFEPRSDWHRKLDVDFMADPRTVSQSQFEEIAKLNNDAYTRREAADFERISRASDGTAVTPEMYTGYVDEMRDFIKKKRDKIAKIRKNPDLLSDPDALADYHRLMAQENKYISRIEAANKHLRGQEGLMPTTRPQASSTYVVHYDEQGKAVIRQRSDKTLAKRASSRVHGNLGISTVGNTLGGQVENRALIELSESMAEAARRNPARWGRASEDIARMVEHMSPSEKGRLIESIKRRSGPKMAEQVAEAMRKRAGATEGGARARMGRAAGQLDDALRGALGVSDDLSRMGRMRRGFNEAASKALGGLDQISRGAVAVEVVMAADSMRDLITHTMKATDPNITDEEADEHFEKAMQASKALVAQGALGALFEAVPTTGVVFLGWTIGYDGTNYILTNTETGEVFNRGVLDYFDSHKKAQEDAWNDIQDYIGWESDRSRAADQLADLESSLIDAIKEGRVVLKPGGSVKNVIEMIRRGDILGAREWIEQVDSSNATAIVDHLQEELLFLYQLAGKINADHERMQAESQTAQQQRTIANGYLAQLEDLRDKLSEVNTNCERVSELKARIQEDSQGAVKMEKLVQDSLGMIDSRAKRADTEGERQRLLSAFRVTSEAAGKIGAAARHARDLNQELTEIVEAAQKAGVEYSRGQLAAEQGLYAAQQGISACHRVDSIAERHAEHFQDLAQRRAFLLGQIARMREALAEQPAAIARLAGIEQGVQGVRPGPPTESVTARSRTTREDLEHLQQRLRSIPAELVDPEACGGQETEDDAVAVAEQASRQADARVAKSERVLDGIDIDSREEEIDITELTRGIRNVPPSETPARNDLDDLTRGIRNRPPEQDQTPVTIPGSPYGTTSPTDPETPSEENENDPDWRDRYPRPVVETQPPTHENERPLYAIYGVHQFPPAPRGGAAEFQAWKRKVSDARTFQPVSKPSGYLAFRVTGEILKQYREHQQKQEAGETEEPFYLFRPAGKYHQTTSIPTPSGKMNVPLMMSFVRLEREEPVWVRETTIGLQEGSWAGRIETLSDPQTLGSWSTKFQGNEVHFGPLQYDGEENWKPATREQAVQFMRFLIRALESMFR